ncbi:MAG: PilN domain-containing protein [Candidatus Sericytochromatia bacterium]|nr:PilN domain-containing protein [Candidatus Tanganyikabacteria bacterium]
MKVLKVNLLPPESKEIAGVKLPPYLANLDPGFVFVVVVGSIVSLGLPVLLTGLVDTQCVAKANATLADQEISLKASTADKSKLVKRKTTLEQKEQAYDALRSRIDRSNPWAEVLEELRMLTPTDLWLTELSASGTTFTLRGAALDSRSIAYLYTNLQTARNFADPALKPIEMEPGEDGALNFEITVRVTHKDAGGEAPPAAPAAGTGEAAAGAPPPAEQDKEPS